ncbi:MAG: hypothetical protein ABIJ53_05025, partial [Verrucomicrobiota bacterium]
MWHRIEIDYSYGYGVNLRIQAENMMQRAKLYVVLLALGLGWYGLPGQGFARNYDYTQYKDFDVVIPGDIISFTVTPPAPVVTGYQIAGGDYPWFKIGGNPASWRCTVPPNPAGQHSSRFEGTYGGPGPGPSRKYWWEMKTDEFMIKVDKVQYEQPSGTWNDISGTLYVLKGFTVTFKAVPTPLVTWPSGKPVWGGTSGASGAGETKAVAFNTSSTTLTDYKTVTATCGNTKMANIVVYELAGTLTPDDNFASRSQSKYGLEEQIELAFTTDPAGITAGQAGGLEWTKNSGVGAVNSAGNDGTAAYDAKHVAGNVTFRLTIKAGPCKDQFKSYDRTVVAPTGTRMTRVTANVKHNQGTASAGIALYYWLDPTEVSFKKLTFGE